MSAAGEPDITPTELCEEAFFAISGLQAIFWGSVLAVSVVGTEISVFYYLLILAVNLPAVASLVAAVFLLRYRKRGWKHLAMIAAMFLMAAWDAFVGVICVVDLFLLGPV